MSDKNMVISRTALFALLDAFPAPDDSGPWGPIGPVIRQIYRGDWVSLNPQPEPPGKQNTGPQPEPWRAIMLTQGIINSVFTVHQVAVGLGKHELGTQLTASSQRNVAEFVDDFCGTKWPRWPFPHPIPNPWGEPGPIDLIVSAAVFDKAAKALGGTLGELFAGAASKLAEQGVTNLG